MLGHENRLFLLAHAQKVVNHHLIVWLAEADRSVTATIDTDECRRYTGLVVSLLEVDALTLWNDVVGGSMDDEDFRIR